MSQCPDCGGGVKTEIIESGVNPTTATTCSDCGKEVFTCVHCGEAITKSQTAAVKEQYRAPMAGGGGADGEYVQYRYCSVCEDKVPIDIELDDEELAREMSENQQETLREFDVPIPYATFVTGPKESRIVEFYNEQVYYNSEIEKEYVSDRWLVIPWSDKIELYVMYDEAPHMEFVMRYDNDDVTNVINKILQRIANRGDMSGVPNRE